MLRREEEMTKPTGITEKVCGIIAALFVFSAASSAETSRISVVYAEKSAATADCAYNKAMARNISRWLASGGIGSSIHSDADPSAAFAPGVEVAHLLNFDNPQKEFIESLDGFIKRGGRIVVYNSGSQKLGDLMGVKILSFAKPPEYRGWNGFKFKGKIPLYCPEYMRVSPSSICTAVPQDGGKSKISAWWIDSSKKRTDYAAVITCPAGFWITGLILDDDDGASRMKFLTAISGACSMTVWRESATALYYCLWPQISGKESYEETVDFLRKYCPSDNKELLEEKLKEADKLHSLILSDRKAGLLAAATVKLWDLKNLMFSAYAVVNSPWEGAVRAVWDHNGMGIYPGDWDATCSKLAQHGITDLFVFTATPVRTHATVPGLTPTLQRKTYGDALAQAVKAGHSRGIRVHAWICALNLTTADVATSSEFRKSDSCLESSNGRILNWLEPSAPAVRKRLHDTVGHILRNYEVDGIHIDYIRYQDFLSGWGDKVRADYERFSAKPVKDWPRDVKISGKRFKSFTAFRAFRIESLVKYIRAEIKAVKPDAKIIFSTAVYGGYPLCIDSVGQDWKKWLDEGTIDWAMPMNYAQSLPVYAKHLRAPCKFSAKSREKIISGIGVSAAESSLEAPMVIDQINATRRGGLGGYALFDLDMKLAEEILPYLPEVSPDE